MDSTPHTLPLCAEGIFGGGKSLAIFKRDANASTILFNPTGLLYLRTHDPAATAEGGGGATLSGAAVAGIAAGACAMAALLVGAAALLVWQRRLTQRRACALKQQSSQLSSASSPAGADEAAGDQQTAVSVASAATAPMQSSSAFGSSRQTALDGSGSRSSCHDKNRHTARLVLAVYLISSLNYCSQPAEAARGPSLCSLRGSALDTAAGGTARPPPLKTCG